MLRLSKIVYNDIRCWLRNKPKKISELFKMVFCDIHHWNAARNESILDFVYKGKVWKITVKSRAKHSFFVKRGVIRYKIKFTRWSRWMPKEMSRELKKFLCSKCEKREGYLTTNWDLVVMEYNNESLDYEHDFCFISDEDRRKDFYGFYDIEGSD